MRADQKDEEIHRLRALLISAQALAESYAVARSCTYCGHISALIRGSLGAAPGNGPTEGKEER